MTDESEIKDDELLLLGLCRSEFTPELSAKLKYLATKIERWDRFVVLANEHGVTALIYKNLLDLGLLEILDRHSSSFLMNARIMSISKNAFHLTAAEEMLSILNREGIKVVLLKGLALELSIFGNNGLRQMTDVDILVHRRDFIRARQAMTDNGYDSLPVKSGLHKPILAWTGRHLPSLLRNGVSVDIHIELFPGKKNKLTGMLLETSSEIKVDREKAYIPAPQLFFLYLVRHLYHHELNNESQLRLYTDLVFLLEKKYEEIINYDLLELASEAGMTQILAWKLEPLRDLWGIGFPEWLNDFIDRWFNPGSINRFVFFLKSPRDNKPDRPGYVYRQQLKDIPGIHRKILFLLGDLFPSLRFMKDRYSCKSSFSAIGMYPARLGKLWLLFSK
ncbi:MAG TPA: nucleotidyltransferase family protein [Bacteroidales bacterium]|nr:nucleotidyltransferase family protein [Bacteroidales bacterium]